MGSVLSYLWTADEDNDEGDEEMPNPPYRLFNLDHTLVKKEHPAGSIVNMLKQDPSVPSIDHRPVWLSTDVKPGPENDLIVIAGLSGDVKPNDEFNNYLYEPETHPLEFDCVNTFAIVTQVFTMYQRVLTRLNSGNMLCWQWGQYPKLDVYPRAGTWANALYDREMKALAFFHFESDGKTIYTCRSFDIVAHETGHAVLDSINPKYYNSKNTQTAALHESFGDLTVIFALLQQMDMCDSIVTLSKCDLHSSHFFAKIGEQMADGLGLAMGLRNCDNNLAIDEVKNEMHKLSVVFTGAVYDILVDIFELTLDLTQQAASESLFVVGNHLLAVVLLGFMNTPDEDASFADVANSIIHTELNDQFRDIMLKQFEKRKIFNPTAQPLPYDDNEDKPTGVHLCGTMMAREAKEAEKTYKTMLDTSSQRAKARAVAAEGTENRSSGDKIVEDKK